VSERWNDSASGLRPLSAFLVVAFVLALIGARALWLVARDQPGATVAERVEHSLQVERDLPPAWTLVDADGRPLALSQVRLDLILSPNALWQAHTPARLAERLSAVLGGKPSADELLARMLPDAEGGVVRVRNARTLAPLSLGDEEARKVGAWIAAASQGPDGGPRALDGMHLERGQRGWELCWEPAKVLSESARALHLPAKKSSPRAWSRFLADGLARCLLGDDAIEPGPAANDGELRVQREAVWRALMPSTWTRAVVDFDASRAADLAQLFEDEHVTQWQMRIERDRKRSYPAGQGSLLGFWGFVSETSARRSALRELGFDRGSLGSEQDLARCEASLSADQHRTFEKLRREGLARTHALAGLELACDRLLADPRWDFLRREPASFSYLQQHAVALRQGTGGLRSYYLESSEASPAPLVVTTLDSLLQRFVDEELARLVSQHEAALAQAIVVDVATGDVLAGAARSPYELSGWAPVFHQFLPGSTFKVPVMAIALEEGAVEPGTPIDIGNGKEFRLPGRLIREAELSNQSGVISAALCLAHSVNAGLVQIGLRVPAEALRARLRSLHYSEPPDSGLGGERPGWLPPLPWKPTWEHASVSFGYETMVTLWQHAAALTAIVRGGEWKPLRLLAAVEQDGRRFDLPYAEAERVFSEQTCEQVRDMMHLGATLGTGKTVVGPERAERFGMGSKTGTAERTGSEVCAHVELQHMQAHMRAGTGCPRSCRAGLDQIARPHTGACMALSMALFGRRTSDGRELFALVVVDEPRRKARYGSDTAGPAAVRILEEALGLTARGVPRAVERVCGFRKGATPPAPTSEQPWAEVEP
jgi:cell division protein FtsI/penicillin-binding protein 2